MDLSQDDVLKILEIAEQSRFDEIVVEVNDVKIHCKRGGGKSEVAPRADITADGTSANRSTEEAGKSTTAASRSNQGSAEEQPNPNTAMVRAPMLGTFYRGSSPEVEPFVEVGSKVAPHDTVCLIEVMKLFNSVKAGVEGTISEILVEDGALVEFGQPVMSIIPIAE